MSGKKPLGTFETGVEVRKPVRNWRSWGNDERHVGARPKCEQLALIESDGHRASLILVILIG